MTKQQDGIRDSQHDDKKALEELMPGSVRKEQGGNTDDQKRDHSRELGTDKRRPLRHD